MAAIMLTASFLPSMFPYAWGERDGSGILLWVFTVWVFYIALIAALIAAGVRMKNYEDGKMKPSYIVLIGSALTFFLNWLFPYIFVNFDYFQELNTAAWMWIIYLLLPVIYWLIAKKLLDEDL